LKLKLPNPKPLTRMFRKLQEAVGDVEVVVIAGRGIGDPVVGDEPRDEDWTRLQPGDLLRVQAQVKCFVSSTFFCSTYTFGFACSGVTKACLDLLLFCIYFRLGHHESVPLAEPQMSVSVFTHVPRVHQSQMICLSAAVKRLQIQASSFHHFQGVATTSFPPCLLPLNPKP
jgi:hypothetical protein